MDLNELIQSEELHVKRLQELVQQSIVEENLLTQNLLEIESDEELSLSQRLADRVASFGGSWKFILSFGVFIFIWIATNIFWLNDPKYDPYPFIFFEFNFVMYCCASSSGHYDESKPSRRERSSTQPI